MRRFVAVPALIALAAGVAGCSVFEPKTQLPCPSVKIDRDTVRVTQFRQGGTDITDTVMEAEITGYTGTCTVDRETNLVNMALNVTFRANLGPAAAAADKDGNRKQSFQYFVALPDYFPHPDAKQIFTTEIPFPPNVNQVRYRDAEVTLRIPLPKSQSSRDARVYLGMQLTEDQLTYNRKNRPVY